MKSTIRDLENTQATYRIVPGERRIEHFNKLSGHRWATYEPTKRWYIHSNLLGKLCYFNSLEKAESYLDSISIGLVE